MTNDRNTNWHGKLSLVLVLGFLIYSVVERFGRHETAQALEDPHLEMPLRLGERVYAEGFVLVDKKGREYGNLSISDGVPVLRLNSKDEKDSVMLSLEMLAFFVNNKPVASLSAAEKHRGLLLNGEQGSASLKMGSQGNEPSLGLKDGQGNSAWLRIGVEGLNGLSIRGEKAKSRVDLTISPDSWCRLALGGIEKEGSEVYMGVNGKNGRPSLILRENNRQKRAVLGFDTGSHEETPGSWLRLFDESGNMECEVKTQAIHSLWT